MIVKLGRERDPRGSEMTTNVRWWIQAGLMLGFLLGVLPGVVAAQVGGGGLTGGSADASGTQLQPLTLDEALTRALESNRELRRAQLGLLEAEGQVTEAWGNVYPRVDLSTSYTRNLSPTATFLPAILFNPDADPNELMRVQFGADNVWSGSISVEQPIFEAQAFVGVGAAGRFQALQEESVRGVVHEVVTGVRIEYYGLLLARERARLTERSLERVRESLVETRALARAGLASEYDVLRLEVEVANLEPQLRRAENEVRQSERELVTQLELEPGARVEPVGSLASINLEEPEANTAENRRLLQLFGFEPPADLDEEGLGELFSRARVNSSALQQVGLNEELRHAELRAEQADFFPRVFLFGSYDVQAQQDGSPEFFGMSGQRGYGRNVGIRVSIPLFTGMQRGARVQQRRASLRSAELEFELAEDRLRDELRTVLESTEEARLRSSSQALAVEQARRGYEIASAQYREGTSSQLELTDAEVALRQSEFNYAEAVFDYLSARAQLDRIVGQMPVPGQ